MYYKNLMHIHNESGVHNIESDLVSNPGVMTNRYDPGTFSHAFEDSFSGVRGN